MNTLNQFFTNPSFLFQHGNVHFKKEKPRITKTPCPLLKLHISYKSSVQQIKSIYFDADQVFIDEISNDANQIAYEKQKRSYVQREVPIQLLSEKKRNAHQMGLEPQFHTHRKVPILSSKENSIIQKRKSIQK
ncbi:unnamed protein product (macronuclear) [Paramecium tetraurelia]|uniref:Uncharacterized protein n=1 Tax=Paramecium tetraurelia TaxID=5888 RepID=A0DID4_PARTE|nr:uncharacterized protein GSPATT00017173001 [Paramecium tetraurelia]CAK82801.1 unnamed protein product [Paramecium tetraurelia]|eukprot:XP_001450198.1 hypothetical protein (macronuclear) [Paramecium tetraurelia strain d4-2]